MKRLLALTLILLAPALSLAATVENPAHTGTKSTIKKHAAASSAAAPVVEAALTPEEIAIAERVHVGKLPCELGNTVHLESDAKTPGYFNLEGRGFKFRMRPVATTTGAVRLEDSRAGAVWLQLGNKSMLMDQKQGRRLADECASPAQVAVAEQLKKTPAQSLLEQPAAAANK
jgi:hypothetical protein